MAKKHPRIAVEKVFVTRKLSTGVTTLTIAKFFNAIIRKSRGMLQLLSRDIRNVFSHNHRKLNDRQSRYINRQVVKIQLASTR